MNHHSGSTRRVGRVGLLEPGELFLDLRRSQGEIPRVPDGLLAFAAEHVAQELLYLGCEFLAGPAVEADIHVTRERIASARGILCVTLVVRSCFVARQRQRFQARPALLESTESDAAWLVCN